MIRFFNTLSGKLEPFHPLKKGEVKLYTCGPTVYDHAHIGNFRAYAFEDLLKRFLVFMGYKVTHVMNITDVDDKTIKGAHSEGISLQEYTKKYIDSFFKDIDTLRMARADHYPRATEHIPEMIQMIKGLMEKGYAYAKDGSIYFSIAKFPNYGRLSKINLKELKPGERVELDEYEKDNIIDFALWKHKKEGEPFWETEVGPGRPGWHIECSVMSSKYLGETFDIHCGGTDNIFPHHENEIAQSEAYFGKKFVNYWLHCRHLIVDGEKMSKSLGNQYTMRDLLEKNIDPLVIRFLLISTHYRKMLNFTFKALEQASASLGRMKDFLYELKNHPFKNGENKNVAQIIEKTRKNFAEGLGDDLNISVALRALFEMIRKVNSFIGKGKIFKKDAENLTDLIRCFDTVLAVLPEEKEDILPEEIMIKINEREKARRDRNFELADRIRDQLAKEGIVLEDTKDGVRWKKVRT
ncbi:MAG: cysteine--tRNA ligase [Candidatus Aminicenantes bacterium]|nr:cysteine--tRNA ligase [Candidatus Aminicenantes bacterium]